MSAHTRTEGEKEAQRVKRYRRYAASRGLLDIAKNQRSVGSMKLTERQQRARKGTNCQLGHIHRDCGKTAVRRLGASKIRICQRHWDLVLAIKADADAKAGHKHCTEVAA